MATAARVRPVVLAAPSGAGKTTIARRLVGDAEPFVFSTSATTRAPRPGEIHGVDYFFTDEATFREMVQRGEMAEWACVHGSLYGTPRRNLDRAAAAGRYPLLDIDVQGARQIRERVADALLVFVLPPSPDVWLNRLRARGTEDRVQLARRLHAAVDELDEIERFDAVVVNDDLDQAVRAVRRVVLDEAAGADADEVRRRVDALKKGVARALDRMHEAPEGAA